MRNIYLTILSGLLYVTGFAQTPLITASNGGFENASSSLTANGWTAVSDLDNIWVVGTFTPGSGAKSAYITNNGGTDNDYRTTKSRTSHFYRDIAIPAGATNITLSFQWKAGGEFYTGPARAYDQFLVYTAPSSVTPVAGVPTSNSTALTGATLVFDQVTYQSTFNTETISLPSSLAGTTVRLIFTWQNDASLGTQPGAAVDGISLTYVPAVVVPAITSFTPGAGCESTTPVVITGTNFTGATAVSFGGTAALSFTVNTATQITATPAAGASGTISISTPAGTATSSANFTVNQSGTIAVSGSATQAVCVNTPITNISYAAGGGATGASITAGSLPAGITGVFSGGNFIISGTPTASGSFSFTVTTTGSACSNPSLSGTITVNPNAVISLSSATGTASQTVCINAPITNISYAIGGSGTGAAITAGALPAGVTGSFAGGVFTITGVPTASGIFNYTITTSGPCVNMGISGTITVNANATISLSSAAATSPQVVCINNAVTNITYAVGGSGTGAAITAGALPAGVTGSFAAGVFKISGTPTISGTFNYTITTTGPCLNNGISGTITVNPDATIVLSSAAGSNVQTKCINNGISNITYSIGGSGTGATVSGLPTGVNGSYSSGTFTISGTPAVAGVFNYTVTASGPCVKPALSGTITVTDNATIGLSSAAGTDAQTNCINNAITPISYAIGGAGTNASLTAGAFPAGVTGAYAAGVFTISGIPAVSGSFNYTITATGSPCLNLTATGTITVNADATIVLSSAPGTDAQTSCINNAITSTSYLIGGGGTGASITLGALPAGVTGSYNVLSKTFTISGTPTVAGSYNYTISAGGPCLIPAVSGTITVTDNATISLSSAAGTNAQTGCINTPITPVSYAIGGAAANASLTSGAFPAGVTGTYNSVSKIFTISGTATVPGSFNYTITATGSTCLNLASTGTITVNPDATITLSSGATSNVQTRCINNAISTITYSIGGSGNGATVTGLPAGVTGAYSAGTFSISGTPTVAGTFTYTVTASGPCIKPALSGTITVTDNATIGLLSAAGTNAQTICINNALTPITYQIGGLGTNASISSGAFPAGVTGSYNPVSKVFTISGTPTVSGSFNYTIRATGSSCLNLTSAGTITVNADATITLSSGAASNVQTKCINTGISTVTYSIGGGGTGATVTGLPTGVTGSYNSGTFSISGTPTVAGTFNYIVTASGPCIKPALSGTITVTDNATISLSSAVGTNAQTPCINTAITPITYQIGGLGTNASLSGGTFPAGVTGSYNSVSKIFTISGIPTLSGSFNYTITATGSTCLNLSSSGTINVNADATISLSSGATSNVQTRCINNSISNITYSIGGGGTGATVTGLPTGITGTYNSGTFSISGTPTVAGTFNYIVTASGPCVKPALGGTITVTDNATIALSSAAGTNAQTKCINNALTSITYQIAGLGSNASLTSGAFPAGVTGTYNSGSKIFTISGTPTVSGTFNYTITATGSTCLNLSASGTITVTADATIGLTSAAGTNAQTKCINNAITNITYLIGGSGTGASVVVGTLPAGVTGSYNSGSKTFTISGTPTVAGVFSYTVTSAGPCVTPALSGTITVTDNATIALFSAAGTNAQTKCINNALTPVTYQIAGLGTNASLTSGALPAGVTGIYNPGSKIFTISGTPTVSGTFNYTITATGSSCLNLTSSGTITVNPNSTISLSSLAGTNLQTRCINNAISNITYNIGGSGTGATVTGLPAGVNGSFAAGVFTISGTPAAAGIFNYTVTAAGPCINPTATGTITVNGDALITLSSAAGTNAQAKCLGSSITNITYAIGVGATAVAVSAGALPAGVTGAFAAGVYTISGTPTVSGIFNYTITTNGPCITASASGTITINTNTTISLTSTATTTTQTLCQSSAISNITYAVGGGGTGATVSGLPTGVTGSYAAGVYTISGTPTVAGIFNYTVTTTGPCTNATATGSLTVNAIASGALVASSTSICPGNAVSFTAPGGYAGYLFRVNGTVMQNGPIIYNTTALTGGELVTVEIFSNGCSVIFTAPTVTVNPLPTPSLIADKTSSCPGEAINFTAGGGVNYAFKINGATVQNGALNTYSTSTLSSSASVTVAVSNASGCTAISGATGITVNPLPAGTLTTPSSSICQGDNVTFTATGGSSYQFKVNGTIVQAFSALNTYSSTTIANASVVTVAVSTAAGCSATYPGIFMTVNDLPAATLTATENSGVANDNHICYGSAVNFTATPGFVNYEFKVNGVSQYSGSSETYTSSSLANNDIVTVVASNLNGCIATVNQVQLTVDPLPAGTLTASATTICQGTNVVFTATAGFANYNFKVDGATVQNGGTNTYSNNGLTDNQAITVEVTNASGCIKLFNSLLMKVNALPGGSLLVTETSGIASNDFTICAGATVNFTATAGFSNYKFLVNGSPIQNGASNNYISTTLANSDIVSVEITNATGCKSTIAGTAFTVNALPVVAAITGTANVCAGSNRSLSTLTTGGVWSSSNTTVATVNAAGLVTGVAAGTANIIYTVTNAANCSNSNSVLFTVNALPVVAAIAGNASVCAGQLMSLSDATAGGTWSSSNGLVATIDATGNVTGIAAGTATITYSVTNGTSCTTAVTKLITVNALTALPAITGLSALCVNSTITLSNTTAGGTWSSSNLSVATVGTTGIVTGISGGTVTISYAFINGNGCTSTVNKTVTVNALPVPTLSGPNPICQGSTGNVYTTESGQSNYSWVVTNGTITSGGTAVSNTITISWLLPGAKNITVNYTNSNGCVGATSATVANAPSGSLPTLSGPAAVCLNSAGNVYTTQAAKSFYTWTVNGGTITSGGTLVNNTATITWNTSGARSVSINYSDAFGCNAASPTVYPVTVNPLPAATISGTATVCKNDAQPVVTFTGTGGTAPYLFTYKINGGANQTISSVGATATISVNTAIAGTYAYSLVSVQDATATACSQVQAGSATITVNALPTLVINTPATVCSPATADLTAAAVTTGSTAGLAYTYWTNAIATVAYPTPATALAGTYYIKGTNASGCYDIKPVVVTINATGTLVINTPAPVCSPSTVNITLPAITSGSTGTYTLSYWTNLAATTAYTTPATATAGTYYIKGTTAAACTTVQPVTVTVNPTPAVVIVTPAVVCSPATVDLTATAVTSGSTAGLAYTYWTDAGATIAYATPATATAGTYYIKGTTAAGCYNIKPVTVTVNLSPTVVVTPPAAVCSPLTVSIAAAAVTTGSTAGLVYTYFTDAAATASYTTPASAGAGTYYIKGTNGVGCYNVKPVTVTVNPLPIVVINTPVAVCSPATVDLTATSVTAGSTAALTYTYWTNPGATTVYGSPAAATNGTYYIKGATASGCIEIRPVVVTVNTLPTAPVITPATASFCIGTIQTLGAGSAVVWSPVTDLFTDAAATIAYTGQSITTVYAKPATTGTKVYTAMVTNGSGCSRSSTSTLTVNPLPVITVASDYCIVPGKVRLTATAVPAGASFLWNNGLTAATVDVDIASLYSVTATYPTGCSASSVINVSVELVTNGDFSAGNTGFFTEYTYTDDIAGNSELIPEGYYGVGTSANNYHPSFYGKEHTTPAQTGNFMMINGSTTLIGTPARQRTIWQQTVAVQPNTNYYFSAYAMNINPGSPAKLQFEVNGVLVGTIADLSTILPPANTNPTSSGTININNWLRFYSNPTWASGSATTAVIRIINLNTAAGGNDFALDDISFSTLSTFIKLLSATGTDAQAVCANSPLTNIVYSVGSGSTGPTVSGLPSGVTAIYNGVNLTITGTPTIPGTYVYTITTTGTCNPVTATGAITVQTQSIGLTSGSAVQTVCKNAGISNIVYALGGTATNATAAGLPAGVTMTNVGNIFTISGTPTVPGIFNYTITTSGNCVPATTSGTITVQTQTVSYVSGNTAQVICFNNSITNINYNIGGTATGATVSNLPAGVIAVFNSGFVTISGKPTVSGIFNYTVTTSGSCTAATAQISGSITVNALTSITLSAGTASQPYCVGSAMYPISYTIGGAATGATVSGLPTGVTGVYNAGVVTISGTPSQSGTFTYTVNATGTCGVAGTTGTLSSGVNTWTGNVSTNWSDANNWSCGAVPITVTDVLIPTSAPKMPQLTTTSVSKSIVLQTGTVLDLNGQRFTNYGAVSGAGKIKGSAFSTLVNNAAGATSTINFDQTSDGSTNALKDLTILGAGSTLTINTKAAIYGTLSPSAGTLSLNDTMVLRSTATGTARVDQVVGAIAYTATGKVSVERYYPMSRSWRLVTTPLSNTGSILNNWQERGSTNYVAGKGMFITGPSPSGAAGNGLDYSGFNNYSMKGWEAVTGTYVNIGNTKTRNLSEDLVSPGVPTNIGYYAFVRGDRRRTPDNTVYGNMNNTTLSATGKLQTGTQTVTVTSGAGTFPLIGNPYASAIDYAKVIKNNVNPYRFYVFDPSLGAVGLYVVMEDPTHTGNFVPIALPSSTQRNFIQSSQAFFVQVAGPGAASVVFDENNKANDDNPALFRPQTPASLVESMRTTLMQLNPDNSTLLVDGVLLQAADAYNDKVDIQDALKFTNINENLGMMRHNVLLSVERRPMLTDKDTIYLYLAKTTQRKYRFEFTPTNIDPTLTAYLDDSFKGTTTPLSVVANSKIDFDITSDSRSAASNRFRIVFKQTILNTLPVTFKTIKAYQKAKDIEVGWTVENEINIKNYEVEKSADGVKFEKVNVTPATGTSSISAVYKWLDVNAFSGNNFYRIRSIGTDGKFDYSNTVVVKMESLSSGIRIYPNPVTDGIIGAEFKNMPAGIYSASLLNAQGQLVLTKSINHAAGTSMENIKPDYKLTTGIYQLEVRSPEKEITIIKVIVK